MKKYFLIMLVVIVGISLTTVVYAADKDAIKNKKDKVVSYYEELAYVFRSKPNGAILPKAQEFCAGAPFPVDDTGVGSVDLYSINTKGADGLVVNWAVKKIGEVLACDDGDPDIDYFFEAYFQLTLGSTTMVAEGWCNYMDANTPEIGVHPFTCRLNVVSAPPEYVGGLLTSNSLVGRAVTELGYNASSIGTLRIFRERDK